MIKLQKKEDCCGCTACQQICPKQCILMKEDSEGFLYPNVNVDHCINCGLCEKVCPVLNPFDRTIEEPNSYACKSNNKSLVADSSSGGMFTILGTKIIEDGGVVFGAKFNENFEIVHDYTDTIDDLAVFRGSKYVQSRLGDTFIKIKNILEKKRKVLFVGTSCQVAGLNHFLRKQYENLYSIEIICHSIASPKVWRYYLKSVKGSSLITNVTFRDKTLGWKNYGLLIQGKNIDGENVILDKGIKSENLFMRGFLENLTVRPSCLCCPARNYVANGDIMLGDCWRLDKYHPDWDDDSGMTVALVLSEKGQKLFDSIDADLFLRKIPYNEVEDQGVHAPITSSSAAHPYRTYFFCNLSKVTDVKDLLSKCLRRYDRKKYIRRLLVSIINSIPGVSLLRLKKNK